MARFEPIAGTGFPISEVTSDGLPWQLLPLGGAVGIRLMDAQGLAVGLEISTPRDRQGVGFSETALSGAHHREIWIQGLKPGRYGVRAYDPEDRINRASLLVDVVPLRTVRVACFFPPGVPAWNLAELTRRANGIWKPAHVRIDATSYDDTDRGVSLPRVIDINEAGMPAKLLSLSNGGRGADLLVYFLWTIQGISRQRTTGETLGNLTVIDSFARPPTELDRMAHTFAHEIGHFISDKAGPSHDDRVTDLMFPEVLHAAAPGIGIRRARAWRIIRY